MGSITKWSGVGTLEDFRRYRDYDADKLVDQYLNQPAVKVSMLLYLEGASLPASLFLLETESDFLGQILRGLWE